MALFNYLIWLYLVTRCAGSLGEVLEYYTLLSSFWRWLSPLDSPFHAFLLLVSHLQLQVSDVKNTNYYYYYYSMVLSSGRTLAASHIFHHSVLSIAFILQHLTTNFLKLSSMSSSHIFLGFSLLLPPSGIPCTALLGFL
jgi:hypothetical protein